MQPLPLYLTGVNPGVAGMPWAEAWDIFDRHREELTALLGVHSVGLSKEGVDIETAEPELVPNDIEGLRVRTRPRRIILKGADLRGYDWYTKAGIP